MPKVKKVKKVHKKKLLTKKEYPKTFELLRDLDELLKDEENYKF